MENRISLATYGERLGINERLVLTLCRRHNVKVLRLGQVYYADEKELDGMLLLEIKRQEVVAEKRKADVEARTLLTRPAVDAYKRRMAMQAQNKSPFDKLLDKDGGSP